MTIAPLLNSNNFSDIADGAKYKVCPDQMTNAAMNWLRPEALSYFGKPAIVPCKQIGSLNTRSFFLVRLK